MFKHIQASIQTLKGRASKSSTMFLDDRVLGANASEATRDQWAHEKWPKVQLLWAFIILLHFAALLHIDPLVLHALSVLLKLMPDPAAPAVSLSDEAQGLRL